MLGESAARNAVGTNRGGPGRMHGLTLPRDLISCRGRHRPPREKTLQSKEEVPTSSAQGHAHRPSEQAPGSGF